MPTSDHQRKLQDPAYVLRRLKTELAERARVERENTALKQELATALERIAVLQAAGATFRPVRVTGKGGRPTKLTTEAIVSIWRDFERTASRKGLAVKHKVTPATIRAVLTRNYKSSAADAAYELLGVKPVGIGPNDAE